MTANKHEATVRKLADDLIDAVMRGEDSVAGSIACDLATLKEKLNIALDSPSKLNNGTQAVMNEGQVIVTVQVEDRVSSGATFQLCINPADKIEDLKRMVCRDFDIPEQVQRWIISKKIREDKETLSACLKLRPEILYLYLVPAFSVGLKRGNEEAGFVHNEVLHSCIMSQDTVPKMLSAERGITESRDSGNLDMTMFCTPTMTSQ